MAKTRRRGSLGVALLAAAAVVVGCAPGVAPTPDPPASAPASAPSTSPVVASSTPPPVSSTPAGPSASPGAPGAEDGVNPFPTETEQVLAVGRYQVSPPFDLAFTVEVAEPGWESLHLVGEYTDIARFEGVSRSDRPSRAIAFAHPTRLRGAADTPVAGMTPADAVALLAARTDLVVGDASPFTLDGREGLRVDIHAPAADTILLGGPGGSLGLDPARDSRVAVIPLDGDLLVIVVSALPDDLDAAWGQAEPILATVRF